MDKFCIIVQGPSVQVDLFKSTFKDTGVTLIFSTWVGQAEGYTEDDIVIYNEYPSDAGIGNINYQKVTTLNGLLKAKELGFDRALKFRSDMIPTNPKKFLESFDNYDLNFFAWHYTPDLKILGYMVDYFMSGPIDKMIDIWSFEPIAFSVPEAMITNRILNYFETPNYLVKILDDENDVYWQKYNINLKIYKDIKTRTWFDEFQVWDNSDVLNAYKQIFK